MEQYELYIHSNAVEANCTEIEEQYNSGSRFCRRKQDFLVQLTLTLMDFKKPSFIDACAIILNGQTL